MLESLSCYFARHMPNNLTPHESQLITLLREHTGMAPTKAAKALGITKEELAVAKQGLVNKGLVYLANGGRMMANGHALAILKDTRESMG